MENMFYEIVFGQKDYINIMHGFNYDVVGAFAIKHTRKKLKELLIQISVSLWNVQSRKAQSTPPIGHFQKHSMCVSNTYVYFSQIQYQ